MRRDWLALGVVWPAVLAHEGLHWLVGHRIADGDSLHVLAARPRYEVQAWHPDAAWWIVAAAYAPLVVGLLLAGAGLAWALLTGFWPTGMTEWAIVAMGAGWWAVFATPSAGDMEAAQEGLDRARE